MLARDLMRTEVISIGLDEPAVALMDVLVREHIHGLPVVDGEGQLVGVVTQQDIFFATVMLDSQGNRAESGKPPSDLKVRDIMTSPAVSVGEETEIIAMCEMLTKLRIHRVPVVKDGRITGIISSLDVCAALARGELAG